MISQVFFVCHDTCYLRYGEHISFFDFAVCDQRKSLRLHTDPA